MSKRKRPICREYRCNRNVSGGSAGNGYCTEHGGIRVHHDSPERICREFVRMAVQGLTRHEIAGEVGVSKPRLDEIIREGRRLGFIPVDLDAPYEDTRRTMPPAAAHPALQREGDPACRGADPEDFYPLDRERIEAWEMRARRTARDFCDWCPVVDACLAWALAAGEPGLWGGTVESDRRRMRRERQRRNEATA